MVQRRGAGHLRLSCRFLKKSRRLSERRKSALPLPRFFQSRVRAPWSTAFVTLKAHGKKSACRGYHHFTLDPSIEFAYKRYTQWAVQAMKNVKKRKALPAFKSEDEEREFWATHDSMDYIDWSKAERVVFPNLKPSVRTISVRLPVFHDRRSQGACKSARRALPVLAQGVYCRASGTGMGHASSAASKLNGGTASPRQNFLPRDALGVGFLHFPLKIKGSP